jgi:signal transduction histidine kinase
VRQPRATVSQEVISEVSDRRTVVPREFIDAGRFAVVSRLAEDLAHEIKNPLHSMVINLEVMKRRVEKGSIEGALERSAVLEFELHRLHQMVEALLVLLRPAKNANDATDVSEALGWVVELVAVRARLAHITFSHAEVPGEVRTPTPADALRYAVLALTDDALSEAKRSGSAIRLTCDLTQREIVLGIKQEDGHELETEPVTNDGGFDGAALAAALLEPSGGTVQREQPKRASERSTVLLRIPRNDFKNES